MKKQGFSTIITTLITILIFIVGVGIVWIVLDEVIVNEPHFKITKEECWNETKIIGYKSTEIYNITYPYTVRTYMSNGDFIDEGWFEDSVKNEFPDCNTNYCHYDFWNRCDKMFCYGVEYKIWKKDYLKEVENEEPIEDTRIVCEQVEVDELNKSWDSGEFELHWVSITKEYLTIDWLDKNCFMTKLCEVKNKDDCIEEPFREENYYVEFFVKEYKCGDYYVEVWNQFK